MPRTRSFAASSAAGRSLAGRAFAPARPVLPIRRPGAARLRPLLPGGWSEDAKDFATLLLTALAAAAALGAASAQITLPGPTASAAANGPDMTPPALAAAAPAA